MTIENLNCTDSKIEVYKKINANIDKTNEVISSLELKADTSTVNAELAIKANSSDVNTALGLKADKATTLQGYGITDGLNKSQITNCILSVEQLVKVIPSTDNGQLTLQKGSIVYVSTNGTFNEVTIQSDVYAGSDELFTPNADRNLYACYVPSLNEIRNIPVTQTYSQATAPSASSMLNSTYCGWFDTTNNIMKYTYDGGATWTICSLPFVLGNPISDGAGWYQHVQQVFNGFGVVGQKTFSTRGVKALLPNGRNSDGTLKNKEVTTTSLAIYDATGNVSQICFWDGSRILTYGVNNYFEQDYKPTFSGNYATWLNTKENIMYQTSDGGTTWNTTRLRCFLGVLQKGRTGNITYFEASKPVELVKKDDLDRAFENYLTSAAMPVYSNGKAKTIATSYTASSDGYLTFTNTVSHDDISYTLTIVQNGVTKTFNFGGKSKTMDYFFEFICVPVPKGATYEIICSGTSTAYEMTFFPLKGV